MRKLIILYLIFAEIRVNLRRTLFGYTTDMVLCLEQCRIDYSIYRLYGFLP